MAKALSGAVLLQEYSFVLLRFIIRMHIWASSTFLVSEFLNSWDFLVIGMIKVPFIIHNETLSLTFEFMLMKGFEKSLYNFRMVASRQGTNLFF